MATSRWSLVSQARQAERRDDFVRTKTRARDDPCGSENVNQQLSRLFLVQGARWDKVKGLSRVHLIRERVREDLLRCHPSALSPGGRERVVAERLTDGRQIKVLRREHG